jgi:hypothetical protein
LFVSTFTSGLRSSSAEPIGYRAADVAPKKTRPGLGGRHGAPADAFAAGTKHWPTFSFPQRAPMTISIFPARRLSRLGVLAATALLVLGLLLTLATGAEARRTACASASHRSARACAQARHHHKTSHSKHSRKHHVKAPVRTEDKTVPPVCEDGSEAVRSDGGPQCDDGSEPQCSLGTAPVLSPDGKPLVCRPEGEAASFDEGCRPQSEPEDECTKTAPESGTSACDDGSTATQNDEGVYVCGDGTEPRCPDPAALTLSESGTSLVCEPAEEAD